MMMTPDRKPLQTPADQRMGADRSNAPALYKWMTAQASGRAHTHGADDGRTGWRLHAVDVNAGAYHERWTRRYGTMNLLQARALCGLKPQLGWSLDMFVDTPCSRCERAAEKRGIELPDYPP